MGEYLATLFVLPLANCDCGASAIYLVNAAVQMADYSQLSLKK